MSRLFLLTALACATVASGCGGTETASVPEFQQAVVVTRDRVDFALSRITKAKSRDDFLDRMEEAAETIEDAASDLSDVEPPTDYTPETSKLVDALHQLAIDLDSTAEQVRQPGFENLFRGAAGLNFDSWDKANLALAGLAGKGIEVSIIQNH